MGFLDRFKVLKGGTPAKLMSDELSADLKQRQDLANAMMAANPGAATPDMDYAQFAQRVMKRGVEAPGVIRTIRPTERTDLGGGRPVDLVVSVEVGEGERVDAQVRQHLVPAQLQTLREGGSVTVKYDPDDPTRALLVGW